MEYLLPFFVTVREFLKQVSALWIIEAKNSFSSETELLKESTRNNCWLQTSFRNIPTCIQRMLKSAENYTDIWIFPYKYVDLCCYIWRQVFCFVETDNPSLYFRFSFFYSVTYELSRKQCFRIWKIHSVFRLHIVGVRHTVTILDGSNYGLWNWWAWRAGTVTLFKGISPSGFR